MTAPVDLPRLTALLERATWKTGASIQEVCDGTTARGELLNYDQYLPALIAELTAARERLAELEGALQSILKVRVEGWENIWAGSNRCQAIARAALNPENSND